MRRVLKTTGSLFVHCDWHASHYIKAEMDKIFGYENFPNEVIWQRTSGHNDSHKFNHSHDIILAFSKASHPRFNAVHVTYSDEYLTKFYRHRDSEGRVYRLSDLTAAGIRHGETGRPWRGIDITAKGKHWQWTVAKLDELDAQGKIYWPRRGDMPAYKRYLDEMPGRALSSIWEDISPIQAQSKERIGYPTQKPEALIERIIRASSNEGDIVADFFCGGGVTPVVAQRLGRRWIACDSSRIAVSVTLDRLVKLGEEQSGVTSNYGRPGHVQAKMDLPTPDSAVPDMRVHYVGVYPMDRFKAVDQQTFEGFILGCLAAQADNSESAISGWRSAREPLRVGPADPDAAPDPRDVQAFFEAVIRKLQPNVRTIARYVCWRTSPELTAYRRKLSDYVRKNIQPRGADLDFDFLHIDSEEFRDRIRQKYPDADDNEFFLRFTKEPVIGQIAATCLGPRKYRFEARDADSTNAGGYLVNCQWGFDFQRGHFAADREYVLGRRELKGKDAKAAGHKFEAVLTAEHTFQAAGPRTVACRVQDNLGAESIRTLELEVS